MSEPIKPEVGKWYWVFCGYKDYVFQCVELDVEFKYYSGRTVLGCKMISKHESESTIVPYFRIIQEHIPPRTWREWFKGLFVKEPTQ